MKLVNIQTQSYEDVPDEQAQTALQNGTHAFESAEQELHVKAPDGGIYKIPASSAAQAFQQGATIAPQGEVHHAQVDEKYGGVGGGVAAALEGGLRGATVGLSDPVQIKLAEMFGKGKEAREALSGLQEAHPYLSTATEIGGAALPVLATGGAAAPEEAAALAARTGVEAAEGGGRMAALLRAVGAPARGVAKAGDVAGQVAERALTAVTGSPTADSAMARVARMAIKNGFQGAVEGGIFGAGQQVSEDALGDHELNAEKLVAAVGHGALWGGMVGAAAGGGIQAAKETFGSVLSKAKPWMEKQANIEAAKAFNPSTALVRQAEKRAGGAEALGETARKYDVIPQNEGIMGAAVGPEELLDRTRGAKEKVSKGIEEVVSGSGAVLKASEILAPLDARIAKMETTAAGKSAAGPMRAFRDQLADSLGVGQVMQPAEKAAPQLAPAMRVERTPQEIFDYLRANPEIKPGPKGSYPESVRFKNPEIPEGPKQVGFIQTDPDVPVQKLISERRALQTRLFEDIKTQQARWPVEEMRGFTGELNEIEQEAINKAAHTLGANQGDELRRLNKDYQRLSILEQAAEGRVAKSTSLRTVSLSDYIAGSTVGAGALASGHPIAAAGAVATAYGHKLVREYGNQVASAMLGRLSQLDLIARASSMVDKEVDGAVKAFVTGERASAPRIRLRHFSSPPDEDLQERYKRASESAATGGPNLKQEHLEKVLPGFATHAPKTAQAALAVVSKGSQMLASAQPKHVAPPSLLSEHTPVSEADASSYLRVAGAIEDPVGALTRGLETGKIHKDEVDAIREKSPKFYQDFVLKVLDEVSSHPDSLTYDKLITLSRLTGIALDPSLQSDSVAQFQQTYQTLGAAQQQKAQAQGKSAAPKRKVSGNADDTALAVGNVEAG